MGERNHGEASGGSSSRRVDQWLWFARVVKSRTLAAELVAGGKVRINRERIDKPSQPVRVGDVVTVAAHSRVRVLKVAAMGTRRGPPVEAATLFDDLTPPAELRSGMFRPAAAAAREPGAGRPTKRDRRNIDRFERGGGDDD